MNYVKITQVGRFPAVVVDSKSLQDLPPKCRVGWRKKKKTVIFDKNIIDLLLSSYDICDDFECVKDRSIFKIHFY